MSKIGPMTIGLGLAFSLDIVGLVVGKGERFWPFPPPDGGVQNPVMLGELMFLPLLVFVVYIGGSLVCPPFERWLVRKGVNEE